MRAFAMPKNERKLNRKRHKITDGQKAALREHHASQKETGGAVDLKSMAKWFHDTYQLRLDLSQISARKCKYNVIFSPYNKRLATTMVLMLFGNRLHSWRSKNTSKCLKEGKVD
jgi:hypothetical protein